jgi:hypothetical protein
MFNFLDKELVSKPAWIIQELMNSKQYGNAIGISSPVLGAGMFVTAVDDIEFEGLKPIIVLKNFDISGYFFSRNKISVDDIIAVCPFTSKFITPFLSKPLRDDDNNVGLQNGIPPLTADGISFA